MGKLIRDGTTFMQAARSIGGLIEYRGLTYNNGRVQAMGRITPPSARNAAPLMAKTKDYTLRQPPEQRLSEDINGIGGVTRTFLARIRNLTMGYRISVRASTTTPQ
jgi:hypothetical protein